MKLEDWLGKYHGKGETFFQVWIEQPDRDGRWVCEGVFPTYEEADARYDECYQNVNYPCIGGWYILKAEIVQ